MRGGLDVIYNKKANYEVANILDFYPFLITAISSK